MEISGKEIPCVQGGMRESMPNVEGISGRGCGRRTPSIQEAGPTYVESPQSIIFRVEQYMKSIMSFRPTSLSTLNNSYETLIHSFCILILSDFSVGGVFHIII